MEGGKPNFSGIYTLKSSENEDAFLKAQGIGWVLRKAAKAVGAKRVVIEHVDTTLKIKAGLVDLEYEIGGEPLPTSFMGFEFTDACDWHTDGVSLCQTKLYKDGSKVTTVRTLSKDRQLLTYSNLWVDKNGGGAVRSTQILQRVADLPSAPAEGNMGIGVCKTDAEKESDVFALQKLADGALNTLDAFVTGYDTPDEGYMTPPEEFDSVERLDEAELLDQLLKSKQTAEPISTTADGATSTDVADDQQAEGTKDPEQGLRVKWMWGDAGVSSVLAQANPLRWSRPMPTADLVVDLGKHQDKTRPVLISIVGHKERIRFESPASCATWVEQSTAELSQRAAKARPSLSSSAKARAHLGAPGEGVLGICKFVAPVYCVYFMRRYAKTSWRHKNVLVASAYARRISQLPHLVSAMQAAAPHTTNSPSPPPPSSSVATAAAAAPACEGSSRGRWHARMAATALDLAKCGCKTYVAMLDAASPFAFPERKQVLTLEGKVWLCVDSSPYWMGWVAQGDENVCECVLAMRSADGRAVDSCNHPASPVRAFINGCSEKELPELPFELLTSLSERVTEVRDKGGSGSITLVGFSQGGLVALACALWMGRGGCVRGDGAGAGALDPGTLSRVHLFNCATMFWPAWLSHHLLQDDWWTNPPAVADKITSWVIEHDPLSDIVPGTRGLRAPQAPGTTMVLPAKFGDKDLIKNHLLANFAEML